MPSSVRETGLNYTTSFVPNPDKPISVRIEFFHRFVSILLLERESRTLRGGLDWLEEVTEHPAFQVVILRFYFAPRSSGDRLIVACEQDARAFAQHTGARCSSARLLAD